MLERHQTISQESYCMKQHIDLRYTTVVELVQLYQNDGASSFMQTNYKYTANIVGSNTYRFQHQKKLMAQVELKRLKGKRFWNF